MGFWHTGYLDLHDPTGFGDWTGPDLRMRFDCARCRASFDSLEALRQHRFERHPVRQPRAYFRGLEVGAQTIPVRSAFEPSDWVFDAVEEVRVNGRKMRPAGVGLHLASLRDEFVQLELVGMDVAVSVRLDIRIALDEDLLGVEETLLKMASLRRLTVETIEILIRDCASYRSGLDYLHGITRYLYGVLAKERAPSSGLRFADYVRYFNEAEQTLAGFGRPVAHLIRALVAFHYNRFEDARWLAPTGRLRHAAGAFAALLDTAGFPWHLESAFADQSESALEALMTDIHTETILRWSALGVSELSDITDDLEAALRFEWADYDKMKVDLMLAEACAARRDFGCAQRKARELVGRPETEAWAQRLLARLKAEEDSDD